MSKELDINSDQIRRQGGTQFYEDKKRPREYYTERNRLILSYRTSGYEHKTIAQLVRAKGFPDVTPHAVQVIIHNETRRFVRDMKEMVQEEFVSQARALNKIQTEAFEAWDKSKRGEATLRKRVRKVPVDVQGNGGETKTVVREQTEDTDTLRESVGDPKFLEVARLALADKRALFGINAIDRAALEKNASSRVDVTVKALDKLNIEELKQLEEIALKLKAAESRKVIDVEPNGEVITWSAGQMPPSSGSTSTP